MVGDALGFLSKGQLRPARMCMVHKSSMDDVEEWHSVAYRLGPDEKAMLVDGEKVKWTVGGWHAERMGVEGDEML